MVKRYDRGRVVGVERRVLRGTAREVEAAVRRSQGRGVINTAFIERLNATFRARLVTLVRRGRALARTEAALKAGMYRVGCAYNFCSFHESLRLPAPEGGTARGVVRRKWIERTPAMAAGLTPVRWSMLELLSYPVPPERQVGARRRRPRAAPPHELARAA